MGNTPFRDRRTARLLRIYERQLTAAAEKNPAMAAAFTLALAGVERRLRAMEAFGGVPTPLVYDPAAPSKRPAAIRTRRVRKEKERGR